MSKKRKRIGEILYKQGLVNKENLTAAVKKAMKTGRKTGEILVEMDVINEDDLAAALAKQFGMGFVNIDEIEFSDSVLKLIPEDVVKKYNVLPLGEENGVLKIIVGNPMDLDTLDLVRFRLNKELDCYLASPTKIKGYIQRQLDEVRSSIDQTTEELAAEGHSIEAEIAKAQKGQDDEGPVIRLVNLIIDEAVKMRASDIHVEAMSDRVRVRYRVDGICIERDNIPKNMQPPLVARFKIISGMDIAERRVPQDGRIKRNVGGVDIDFRASVLPGYHGPSIVLRILRPDAVDIGIQALGFVGDDYDRFQKIIKRPNGIFLVTGPTGSGKTTTLYSALKELNRPDKKIITAEDPVEYNVAGINQCQVRTEIGLTFEKILRSMLRQAPNIILVGEIRDGIVADIAIQAALTGHLVFSTLHTNDAPSAIPRLIDMGVKPFLVASSIQAIMAQRLVRRICPNCKVVDENPDPRYLRLLEVTPDMLHKSKIMKGAGCPQCNGTGYRGRLAIFELLEMNHQIRELAFNKAPTQELRKAAIASGMKSLVMDGRDKVFQGVTTPVEIARVAQSDDIAIDDDE